MRRLIAAALIVVASTACGPRPVQIETGAQPESQVTLRVVNDLSQAVNVYVSSGSSDVFVKQVAAKSAEWVAVHGFSAGSTVTLKARTVDGARTYTRADVTLSTQYEWRIP